ncbi:MAG TPA: SgcJ/EcaC family oxidoreductase [Acidimicrobiales bacterium]|jgi:steroid delta-isomerase
MPSPEQVRAVVDDYLAAFPKKDREAFLGCFADDAEQIDPVPSAPNIGKEAIGQFWDNIVGMADKMEPQLDRLSVCGNEAALVFTMNARTGDGGGAIDIVDILEVNDDGKISSLRAYWDPAAMRPLS